MKSRVSVGQRLFQIVVQDYEHRQVPSEYKFYVDKKGGGVRDVVETIPERTLFKWAKNGRRAMDWAKRFGSVISCRKVDSHMRRLDMISYLRVAKPVEVEISAEEFIIGRDLEVEPAKQTKEIEVSNNGGIDK